MSHVSAVAPPCEGYHIIWAGLNAYTTTGTEFSLEIEADRDTILYLVDLFIGNRVERKELECIDRAGNNTIIAPGTPF
jgi:hypothetical protein